VGIFPARFRAQRRNYKCTHSSVLTGGTPPLKRTLPQAPGHCWFLTALLAHTHTSARQRPLRTRAPACTRRHKAAKERWMARDEPFVESGEHSNSAHE